MIFEKLFKKSKEPITSQPKPITEDQTNKVDFLAQGVGQFDAGNYTQAMEFFQAAIANNPNDESAYLMLADSYKALGKERDAISTLHKLLAVNHNNLSAQDKINEIQESINKRNTVEQERPKEAVVQAEAIKDNHEKEEGSPLLTDDLYDPHLDLRHYQIPQTDLLLESEGFRKIVESSQYQGSNAKLPIVMGLGDDGNPVVEDLTKMPHLLIAGMTNYGGPSFLNGLLLSILFKKHPSEVKLVLMGDKRLQLTAWPQIEKHFLAAVAGFEDKPIVDDSRSALRVFKSLSLEMDTRIDLLKLAGARRIDDYNDMFCHRKLDPQNGHRYLPRIVTAVFEVNGLFNKEIEEEVSRLAAMAHTVGIHIVLLTNQALLYSNEIQANIPARLAFKVSRLAESNAILGGSGAQNLKLVGEAIFSSPSVPARHIQCQAISENDIDSVIDFIRKQEGYPYVSYLPEYLFEDDVRHYQSNYRDEFFKDAARLVVDMQFGSTSLLQRKLQLGYNRAGQIMDQLEQAGIVGPFNGSSARVVLIQDRAKLEEILRSIR